MTEEKLSPEEQAELDDTPPEVEDALSEATIKRVAALASAGASKYKVHQTLKLSMYYVKKIWQDELFRKTVTEIGDAAVHSAKATTKNELARLAAKAVKTVEKNLDKHNLEAARIVLRSLGLEQEKPGDDKDKGGITLVLAGQQAPQKATVQVVREQDE